MSCAVVVATTKLLITFLQPEEIPPHIYPVTLPDYLTRSTGNSPVAKYIETYVNRSVQGDVILHLD